MKIKYKVVKRKTRMSAMINGNSKYALQYLDNTDVYADPKTIGIMVFETLGAAESWCWAWNYATRFETRRDLIILKVKPVGRGRRVIFLANGIDTDTLDYWYKRRDEEAFYAEAPDRTMAYPGVEVIGEYIWGAGK